MRDLRAHGVDMLTIGQYLQPSPHHLRLRATCTRRRSRCRAEAQVLGFTHAAVGAMVRSSTTPTGRRHAAGRELEALHVRIVGWFGHFSFRCRVGRRPRRHFQPRRHHGLKEALTGARNAAVARLGSKTGFSGTTASRFLCRPSLRRLEAVMRSIGMDRHADELVFA